MQSWPARSSHVHLRGREVVARTSCWARFQTDLGGIMQIKRLHAVALAAAVALAFSPLPDLKAAPFARTGWQAASGGLVQPAQAKAKAKKKAGKKKRKGKKA